MSFQEPKNWTDYKVGMSLEEREASGIAFERRGWDLESEPFIGMSFSDLIPILLRESRFAVDRFTPPDWIGEDQGGIIVANFKYYGINPHEGVNQQRKTGEGENQFWLPVNVNPNGQIEPFLGTESDLSNISENHAIAFTSRVTLNNLSVPGGYGGVAHFPMLDIVHPATEENIEYLITEVRRKCGLEKFFVLKSSNNGMMVIGAELFDEENFEAFLFDSLSINHVETQGIDGYWLDDRWVSRCSQDGVAETGNRINRWRFNGALRKMASPPQKPDEPIIMGASF